MSLRTKAMDSPDPRTRVAALDAQIAALTTWQQTLQTERQARVEQWNALAAEAKTTLVTSLHHERMQDLRTEILAIDRGERRLGISAALYTLLSQPDRPGLAYTNHLLEEFREERKAWARKVDVDPNERRPYRLKAGKRHIQDGRPIQPGEVVDLNASQAEAFADKFDVVLPEFEAATS